jgi:hypothetical protein
LPHLGFTKIGFQYFLGYPVRPPGFDEDLSMEYDDSTCLSWKEILSLTNNNDKVNSFLIEENVLISRNYILPKAKYCVVFRYVICQDIANGRRGRMAIKRQVEIKSA